MSAAQAGWSQAKMDAAADAEIGIPSGGPAAAPGIPGVNAGSTRSAATSSSSNFGGGSATAVTPARSAATPSSGGGLSPVGGGGGASGRPNSASSAFSTTTAAAAAATGKLPTLRLSASELVNQLQAESSPSPRMPTTPASGGRGR